MDAGLQEPVIPRGTWIGSILLRWGDSNGGMLVCRRLAAAV